MSGYIGSSTPVVSSGSEQKFSFIATTGQTDFSVNFTPGFTHIFQNGVRLRENIDYSGSNGNLITLATPAEENDEIVVIVYSTFQMSDAYTKSEADVRYVTVTAGTSFPASPNLGDEVWRTDLDKWFKYNSVSWTEI